MTNNSINKAIEALRSYGADHLADALMAHYVFDEAKERELFEAGHPKPNGVYWCETNERYMTSFDHLRCIEYTGMWSGWKDCAKLRSQL